MKLYVSPAEPLRRMMFLLLLLSFLSCKKEERQQLADLSPIESLMQGNQRFLSGHPVHPHETLERIRELKKGQHPKAVVVSCSDSRVPPELIFDQGLGDIFSIRTAGNVIGDYELGSIEYAVEHLHCKLIVVMGHEECGAVKAFYENPEGYEHDDHIKSIVEYIAREEEEQALQANHTFDLEHAVTANITHGVSMLRTSEPILKELVDRQEIEVVGALYDLDSGKVQFLPAAK